MPLPEYTPHALSRTAMHFLDQWRDDGDIFDLDPAYQRTSVWTDQQRRAMIRSLQMGLPVGSIWTNLRGRGTEQRYSVVDGKQRITTLRAWFAGEFAVPADYFALRPYQVERDYPPMVNDGHGDEVTFHDLTDVGQRLCNNGWHLSELQVTGLTVEQEAELFLLVNAAGTSHTDQDLDRARRVAATSPR